MEHSNVILGIDPGTTIMGYGVTGLCGGKLQMLAMGVLELHKLDNAYEKLKRIFDRTTMLISEYKPAALAIEAPFFGKNVQSMLKLGRAQGTAIAAALAGNVPVFEYAPRKIKLAITGQGAASKEQVAFMLQKMLGFSDIPANLDATDGLAAAVCHHFQFKSGIASPAGNGSWKEFINRQPGRVKK